MEVRGLGMASQDDGMPDAGDVIFAEPVLDDDDVKWVRGDSRHRGNDTNDKSINNKQT